MTKQELTNTRDSEPQVLLKSESDPSVFKEIEENWRNATYSIIKTAVLIETEYKRLATDVAKESAEQFVLELQEQKIMSKSTVAKLRKIARWKLIQNDHDLLEKIPASYEIMSILARQSDQRKVKQLINNGDIFTDTSVRDILKLFPPKNPTKTVSAPKPKISISGSFESVKKADLGTLKKLLKQLSQIDGVKISGLEFL